MTNFGTFINFLQDGRFFQKDIARVWSKYEEDLHLWLLRLTEEFDLTFPIPDEDKSNIVPCLLPPEPPEVILSQPYNSHFL